MSQVDNGERTGPPLMGAMLLVAKLIEVPGSSDGQHYEITESGDLHIVSNALLLRFRFKLSRSSRERRNDG